MATDGARRSRIRPGLPSASHAWTSRATFLCSMITRPSRARLAQHCRVRLILSRQSLAVKSLRGASLGQQVLCSPRERHISSSIPLNRASSEVGALNRASSEVGARRAGCCSSPVEDRVRFAIFFSSFHGKKHIWLCNKAALRCALQMHYWDQYSRQRQRKTRR